MNTEHLAVARELLKKAERCQRWSLHDRTEADVEEGPKRAALARQYARAAFALLGAEERRVDRMDLIDLVDGMDGEVPAGGTGPT